MWLFTIIILIFLVLFIRVLFFRKPSTLKEYHQQAMLYEKIFMPQKAIEVLQAGKKNPIFTKKEAFSFDLKSGAIAHKMKEYDQAKLFFDHLIPSIKKDKLPYSGDFIMLVLTYINTGHEQVARELYHYLRKNEKHDPRFAQLIYLDRFLWKEKSL